MKKANEGLISLNDNKSKKGNNTNLKPLPFWQSLIFFGVPAILAALGQYVLYPFFSSLGLNYENAYHYQMLAVFTFLTIMASVVYILEGNLLEWSSIKHRLRLYSLNRNVLKWTIVGIGTQAALSVVATILAMIVYDFLSFTPPDIFPPVQMLNIPLMILVLFMNVVS